MFEPSNNPSPFGDSGAGEGSGGDQLVAVVTPEIVPVRIVNTNALLVTVTNFPGQPPPLGGLHASATPPPLPTVPRPKAPENPLNAENLGLGEVLKLGTAVGAVAAGAGLIAEGFHKVYDTFIEPLIGAASGGLQKGIERGSGAEVIGKTFEVLGVTIGVRLLPVTVRLAAAGLVLADRFEDLSESRVFKLLTGATGGGVFGGQGGMGPLETIERGRAMFMDATARIAPFMGGIQRKFGEATGTTPRPEKTGEQETHAMGEVLDDLRRSVGAHAQFVGVADIRQQAQAAALQDPFEVQMKQKFLKMLDDFTNNNVAASIAKTAENTQPKAHHG